MGGFNFSNKVVYIISPERWGGMKVSKHHYALELAKKNCRVFFIEPPALTNKKFSIDHCSDHKNIQIVKYKPIFRGKRYLPTLIFRSFLQLQVKTLLHAIKQKPDVVLCFQGYLFENLRWFKASVNIFFAADQFSYSENPPEVKSADIVVAISDTIYKRLQHERTKVFQINHGLQHRFVDKAAEVLRKRKKERINRQIKVGYSGNLRMEALDRSTMTKVIHTYPEIRFIFWGSFEKHDLNLGGLSNSEADDFILFLQQQPNVLLRGVVGPCELQKEMFEVDAFWLCWDTTLHPMWDGSNSHKILEYLSTGKPVISHFVSSYKDTGLLHMLPSASNEEYLELFNRCIEDLNRNELPELSFKRMKWAIDNAYEKQVSRIEGFVAQAR